jgi:N6-adenosine-specific RNA methylase IME4
MAREELAPKRVRVVSEPLPTIDGGWRCILADPPWRFRTWNETNQKKSASNHYALMTMDGLKSLPVKDLASKDCALVMWATQAQLPDAIDLMTAWGFKYKTAGAWAKQSETGRKWAFGTGYVLRCAAEFYLVGTRGNPKARVRNVRNLIVARKREHSRKPDQMHDDLERLFDGPRLELFGRQSRPGWTVWGNEATKFDYPSVEEAS